MGGSSEVEALVSTEKVTPAKISSTAATNVASDLYTACTAVTHIQARWFYDQWVLALCLFLDAKHFVVHTCIVKTFLGVLTKRVA